MPDAPVAVVGVGITAAAGVVDIVAVDEAVFDPGTGMVSVVLVVGIDVGLDWNSYQVRSAIRRLIDSLLDHQYMHGLQQLLVRKRGSWC